MSNNRNSNNRRNINRNNNNSVSSAQSNGTCNSRNSSIVSGLGFMGLSLPCARNNRNGVGGASVSSGNDSIIPYSSGEQVVLCTPYERSDGQSAVLGFGNTQNGIRVNSQGQIPTSEATTAFSVPEDVYLNSIYCTFTCTNNIASLDSEQAVKAQLYYACDNDTTFKQIKDAEVTLAPEISGTVQEGTVFTGRVDNLGIKVCAGTRILFLCSVENLSDEEVPLTVLGNCEAGVSLSKCRW